MTKLKTLKDISGNAQSGYPRMWAKRDELKQEAIKWIKALQIDSKLTLKQKRYSGDIYGMIWWIRTFFNITEEELK